MAVRVNKDSSSTSNDMIIYIIRYGRNIFPQSEANI